MWPHLSAQRLIERVDIAIVGAFPQVRLFKERVHAWKRRGHTVNPCLRAKTSLGERDTLSTQPNITGPIGSWPVTPFAMGAAVTESALLHRRVRAIADLAPIVRIDSSEAPAVAPADP